MGLSAAEVAEGVAFTTVTLWLGVATVGGVACLAGSVPVTGLVPTSPAVLRSLGVVLLAVPVAYFVWNVRARRQVSVGGWRFAAPGPRLAALQIVTAAVDWLLASLVLYALLAPFGVSLGTLVQVFVFGQVLGLASHVPGGLGVFESVVLLTLRPIAPPEAVLPALIAYRAIYYLIPFAIAAVGLAVYEVTKRRSSVASVVRFAGGWVPGTIPYFLSLTTFAAGVLLMFSGATPGIHARLRWLDAFFPLAVIEVSHLAASMAGMILILLANGIRRRLDVAYHLTVLALVVGIVGSLLKGADYEEASRSSCSRSCLRDVTFPSAALTRSPSRPGGSPRWLVLAGTVWLGVFSYGHAVFSHRLLWRCGCRGRTALRSRNGRYGRRRHRLRTRAFCGRPRTTSRPARRLARARRWRVAPGRPRTSRCWATSRAVVSGNAFIMYGISGRSWVALGVLGPISMPSWCGRSVSSALRQGGWPVFFQVTRDLLPYASTSG